MSAWESNEEIELFRKYLRIPSVHPNVDYAPCVSFLRAEAARLGLPIQVHYPAHPAKPVVVLTWIGTDPSQKSIILNSHMDVVPVYAEYWTHPPFGADIDENGRIFARGTQDMKSVGIQYLCAVKRLQTNGIRLKRTIHIIFVPDEEIGANDGMMEFVKTVDFRNLNAGFSLDEGIASPGEQFSVFYGERSVWRIHFKCSGTTGHGSLLHANTAGERIRYIIDRFMDMRAVEVAKLVDNPALTVGDVTTVNLTILKGGVQTNIVPPLLTVAFDVRLAIDVDHEEFEKQILQWCKEAGNDIEIYYESKKPKVAPTKLDSSNKFWMAFQSVVNDLDLKVETLIFPGRTDSCFIREAGIPALGFSPMNNTPVLLHDNDEFITAETFLRGIGIYERLITNIANV